jgi:hypothetical protein
MELIEKYFENFIVPEDLKSYLIERYGKPLMRVHYITDNGEKCEYALVTPEAKSDFSMCKEHRHRMVSIEEWAKLAFKNYADTCAMFPKLPFELTITSFEAKDPRGNGHISKMKYALITAHEEKLIMDLIRGGRIISMKKEVVDINEWIRVALWSYYDEEIPDVQPDDGSMAITLEELQEYNDSLTMDEKLGNY